MNVSMFAQSIQKESLLANFYLLILEALDGNSDPMEHTIAFRA